MRELAPDAGARPARAEPAGRAPRRRCCAASAARRPERLPTARRPAGGRRCPPCPPARPRRRSAARGAATSPARARRRRRSSRWSRRARSSAGGSRPDRACASSSSTAVPDASATAGEPSASRWATTTIAPSVRPGRTPTTLIERPAPVGGLRFGLAARHRKPVRCEAPCRPARRSRRRPAEPGRRLGNCLAMRFIPAYACPAVECVRRECRGQRPLLIAQRERENDHCQRDRDQPGAVDARIQHRPQRVAAGVGGSPFYGRAATTLKHERTETFARSLSAHPARGR